MLWKKKKVEQSKRDQECWGGVYNSNREVWVSFIVKVP